MIFHFCIILSKQKDFSGGSAADNSPANAGDTGFKPGSGRSLEKETAAYSSLLVWEIAWTGELVGYSPWGRNKSDTTRGLDNKTI